MPSGLVRVATTLRWSASSGFRNWTSRCQEPSSCAVVGSNHRVVARNTGSPSSSSRAKARMRSSAIRFISVTNSPGWARK